ncbi:hypothetical protein EVAR_5378_1 [Eumeta japonica]|uniref:Uncharacterized protein n=1 Tax=Eumeta variegata TaxID=151549 RepID=A0A4C1TNS2_EUMVA|nr:hypothetical protein EVAR_5378_1 [Eumeta japonica]
MALVVSALLPMSNPPLRPAICHLFPPKRSGGARRRRPPTASRLKGPRKQKSFAYKLLKRGLANLMSPTSTSGVAPPLPKRIGAHALVVRGIALKFL